MWWFDVSLSHTHNMGETELQSITAYSTKTTRWCKCCVWSVYKTESLGFTLLNFLLWSKISYLNTKYHHVLWITNSFLDIFWHFVDKIVDSENSRQLQPWHWSSHFGTTVNMHVLKWIINLEVIPAGDVWHMSWKHEMQNAVCKCVYCVLKKLDFKHPKWQRGKGKRSEPS